MEDIRRQDVMALLADGQGPLVSMYLPMEITGRNVRQNTIQLKNAIAEVEQRLASGGQDVRSIRQILDPAQRLLEDKDFWQVQSRTLALFLSESSTRFWKIDREVPLQAYVDGSYHVRPLLPCLETVGDFYLLAVSQNVVRLWRSDGHHPAALDMESVSGGLKKTLGLDTPEEASQFHQSFPAAGKEGAVFHGHGGAADAHKDEVLAYFREIDRAVNQHLHGSHAPLLFAGVSSLFPIYKAANSYRELAETTIEGNPDLVSVDRLHAEAIKQLQERGQAYRPHLRQYAQQAGSGKTSDHLPEVVLAALRGQVDSLFVVEHVHQWGTVDSDQGKVDLVENSSLDSVELYELAAIATLRDRGSVFVLDQSAMPSAEPMAALYRYPISAGQGV